MNRICLTKHMGKTVEKTVCFDGLPQFLISDITGEDMVCTIGDGEKSSF